MLAEAYGDAASADYVEEVAGQRATARAVLERLERHVGRGMLLDLGSWVGFLLAEARDRGWDVVGVEPSEFASAYARTASAWTCAPTTSSPRRPEHHFDAVVLGDVIEHLPRPGEALDRIASLLGPGGVAASCPGRRLARGRRSARAGGR